MRISINMLLLAASVATSGLAAAEDAPAPATGSVAAEKQAPIKGMLPGAYANVELRHDALRAYNNDETIHNDSVALFIIPTIGATLFNDKVDTSFTWKFNKEASSDKLTKYDAYNQTQWNVIDGKFNADSPYNFGPYALTDIGYGMTNDSGFSYADIGFYGEVNYQFPVSSGALALRFYGEPTVQILSNGAANSSTFRVPANNETDKGANDLAGYGVTSDPSGASSSPQVVQQDDTYILDWGMAVKYIPASFGNKLSVGLGLDFLQYWQPVYDFKNVNSVPTQQLDHYSNQVLTMNRLILGYKISDKVSFSEQVRGFVTGYEQHGITLGNQDQTGNVGQYRWENRLAVTATLL